jgi:hypothetical protein
VGRRILAAIAVALFAAGCGAGPGPGVRENRPAQRGEPTLFGIAAPRPVRLYALDRRTLRPRRDRSAPLAGHTFGWSFSPDRRRLAIGNQGSAELRLVDLRRLRVLGDVELGGRGLVFVTTWAGRGRVLAAVLTPGCCGLGDTTVVGVDAESRRVLWRRRLGGSLQGADRTAQGLVLVVGPRFAIGPSRLVQVDGGGTVRSTPLGRIRSGWARSGSGDRVVARAWNPGLALDGRGRAFVVQAGAPVAEVDLRTLAVRYHELSEPISLLGRLRDWLDPAAEAKGIEGPERRALWLGEGRLAVTGTDNHVEAGAQAVERVFATPTGLKLIDTRRWTIRTLDRSTSSVALAGRTLLAGGMTWDSGAGKLRGDGLRAYDLRGNLLYQLYRGQPVEASETVPQGVLVGGGAGSSLFRRGALVEPASGRVLRRLRLDVTIVARDAPAWY